MLRSLDVRAAAPGKVVSVGYATGFEGYGNIVLVQVTPEVVTRMRTSRPTACGRAKRWSIARQ